MLQRQKKRYALKALILSTLNRYILTISPPISGSVHDYTLMKDIFDPDSRWFKGKKLWLDLGFQCADKEYGQEAEIALPCKTPRKSKNNPDPKLTEEQEKYNRHHAGVRVAVEHAIGGMKAFHCLTHRIRNRLATFIDSFFWMSAGLWNLKIS